MRQELVSWCRGRSVRILGVGVAAAVVLGVLVVALPFLLTPVVLVTLATGFLLVSQQRRLAHQPSPYIASTPAVRQPPRRVLLVAGWAVASGLGAGVALLIETALTFFGILVLFGLLLGTGQAFLVVRWWGVGSRGAWRWVTGSLIGWTVGCTATTTLPVSPLPPGAFSVPEVLAMMVPWAVLAAGQLVMLAEVVPPGGWRTLAAWGGISAVGGGLVWTGVLVSAASAVALPWWLGGALLIAGCYGLPTGAAFARITRNLAAGQA